MVGAGAVEGDVFCLLWVPWSGGLVVGDWGGGLRVAIGGRGGGLRLAGGTVYL